ncbi:hypothetical protein BSIN_0291 [Burkholderia singularis]|uniref:Uncharacterized protein n=1 Tax=Burkholderia singularis TaxID=1503053 RepID=A0A238H4G5_9BURK|nr:hypothetical protein BSIN_0291 [Burkholderia singularis]
MTGSPPRGCHAATRRGIADFWIPARNAKIGFVLFLTEHR